MKTRKILDNIICISLVVLSALMMLFLTYYSFRYSYMLSRSYDEIPYEIKDSLLLNILSITGVSGLFAGLYFLDGKINDKAKLIIKIISMSLATLFVVVAGIWWIKSTDRFPEGDQLFLIGGAKYFLEGDYLFLDKCGYFEMYPQNLPLLLLYEIFYYFFGVSNYQGLEMVNVIFSGIIVVFGGLSLGKLCKRTSIWVMYCVASCLCFPMIFYTNWLYGDLGGIAFTMIATYLWLAYVNSKKLPYLILMVPSIAIAVLFRKNCLIFIIALAIAIIGSQVKKYDIKMIIAVVMALIISLGIYKGVNIYYEHVSGKEIDGGMPTSTWIAMGLKRGEWGSELAGWYYDFPRPLYYKYDGDRELVSMEANDIIKDRLSYMASDLPYTKDFFKEKILTQWNLPSYESLFFANKITDWSTVKPGSLLEKVYNRYFTDINTLMSVVQLIVYFGMLLYCLFGIRRKYSFGYQVIPIFIIGGFLFSVMWEAKARYILPYYIVMFPYAFVGFDRCADMIKEIIDKKRKMEKK